MENRKFNMNIQNKEIKIIYNKLSDTKNIKGKPEIKNKQI